MEDRKLSDIAEGLSHVNRVRIINILKDVGGEAYLSEIVNKMELINLSNSFSSVKGHVMKLHFRGIVELSEKDGQFFVRLLKDVIITFQDYKKENRG